MKFQNFFLILGHGFCIISKLMKCPFLEEIVVNYCSVAPVRKMIPKGKSKEMSKCEQGYFECPVYQNYLIKKKQESHNGKKKDK